MATIVQRGKSHSVVYSVNGKQKWETFKTAKEAQKRKLEVEYQQSVGTFVAPNPTTVTEFLEEYVETYGLTKWSFSTYRGHTSLIRNYVVPHIGSWKLKDLNTRKLDGYFDSLKAMNAVQKNGRSAPGLISDRTIYDIYAVLQSAFSLAVEWEYIAKSPISKTVKPEIVRSERDVWEPELAKHALSLCDNRRLLVCMHLALACTMRLGEILGLRWQSIELGDVGNNYSGAKLHINTVLQRISQESIDKLARKKDHIKLIFPALKAKCTTRLVLKIPKTKKSVRSIWLPPTVAAFLWQLKKEQHELKEVLGSEYFDYDLVVAQSNGRPVELRLIEEAFHELITEHDLPVVQFHSLRHTSTTYKLMLSNGDIKAVQGETGHAQAVMVTDVYSHILDQGRKKIAKLFEQSFYNEEPGAVEATQAGKAEQVFQSAIEQLLLSEQGMKSIIKNFASSPDGKAYLSRIMDEAAGSN